jgi:hypothetical protein
MRVVLMQNRLRFRGSTMISVILAIDMRTPYERAPSALSYWGRASSIAVLLAIPEHVTQAHARRHLALFVTAASTDPECVPVCPVAAIYDSVEATPTSQRDLVEANNIYHVGDAKAMARAEEIVSAHVATHANIMSRPPPERQAEHGSH